MEKGKPIPDAPELSPAAGAQAFDEYIGEFPELTAEELLAAFEERLQGAAQDLIDAYGAIDAGQAERRKAMATYGAMAMGKYNLLYETVHNPCAPPAWLDIAKTDLKARTEQDPEARSIVERTPIFSIDKHTQRILGDVVSASIDPSGDYTKLELARGLVSGRVNVRPF